MPNPDATRWLHLAGKSLVHAAHVPDLDAVENLVRVALRHVERAGFLLCLDLQAFCRTQILQSPLLEAARALADASTTEVVERLQQLQNAAASLCKAGFPVQLGTL